MRRAALLVIAASALSAATDDPPAELRVTNNRGSLTYRIVNKSPYRIVAFEVFTSWRDGEAYRSCSFQQPKIKSETDLTARDACVLVSSGAAADDLHSTIRSLQFSNGMNWSSPATNR